MAGGSEKHKRNNNGNYILSACFVPGMVLHASCMLTNLAPNSPKYEVFKKWETEALRWANLFKFPELIHDRAGVQFQAAAPEVVYFSSMLIFLPSWCSFSNSERMATISSIVSHGKAETT